LFSHTAQLSDVRSTSIGAEMPIRVFSSPDTPTPEVQLLSNGRYHVMVTNAGGGYSRWKDLAVTRWREDATCDHWGSFCYVREVAGGVSGECWSTAISRRSSGPRRTKRSSPRGAPSFAAAMPFANGSGAIRNVHRDRRLAGG
jgi:cyclic beta-1,2-glucan synthetase